MARDQEQEAALQGGHGLVDPVKPSKQLPVPWQVLDRLLTFQSANQKGWWERLAPVLGATLQITGYGLEAQYRYMMVFFAAIMPNIGPVPNATASNLTWTGVFPTGEGLLEASVNYQRDDQLLLRFSVEPIGEHAGTDDDPINEMATRQMMQTLSRAQPGTVDRTLYDHFASTVAIDGPEARQNWEAIAQLPCKSHSSLALDLHPTAFKVKAYVGPWVRAAIKGSHSFTVMFDSLRQLQETSGLEFDYTAIEKYMWTRVEYFNPENTYISVDCADPATSRIKVYCDAEARTLHDLKDIWSLGGILHDDAANRGWELVERMWNALFPLTLPGGRRLSAMPAAVNWEISLKDGSIVPKMYFFVLDFFDRDVSLAVAGLFQELGWQKHIQTARQLDTEVQ